MDTERIGKKVEVEMICVSCGRTFKMSVYKTDLDDYNNPRCNKAIQDIFPYLTDDEREMLLTGICGECYDKIMYLD